MKEYIKLKSILFKYKVIMCMAKWLYYPCGSLGKGHVLTISVDHLKFKDYSIEAISELVDQLKTNYVTPHEMVNLINCATVNCRAISYKRSSQAENIFTSEQYTVTNVVKENPPPFAASRKVIEMKKQAKEALWFMRGMMDECTHLKNFSKPVDTSLVISVCAKADGYVPRMGVSTLEDIWPGATIKYVDCGHVGAYIWYRKVFRESIVEAFNKAKKKTPRPSPSICEI